MKEKGPYLAGVYSLRSLLMIVLTHLLKNIYLYATNSEQQQHLKMKTMEMKKNKENPEEE